MNEKVEGTKSRRERLRRRAVVQKGKIIIRKSEKTAKQKLSSFDPSEHVFTHFNSTLEAEG